MKMCEASFFTQRLIFAQNLLPAEVVEAVIITTFKRHLGRHMNRQGMDGHGPCFGVC